MSRFFQVNGQPLPEGHCERHPEVAQDWPCDICQMEELEDRWSAWKEDEYAEADGAES